MINVIGLGYIGLPTALILAANGKKIIGTDINKQIIEQLENKQLPFEEEGINELFQEALANDICFQLEYAQTNCYIITVPTPYLGESRKIDTAYLTVAIQSVLDKCLPETMLIIESTVSPGTIDSIIKPLIVKEGLVIGRDIQLVHAPERILPGKMITELKNNSRTIGADNPETAEKAKAIYASFCQGEIVCTTIKTAEMTKVVENTYRAVNIAFSNELSQLCQEGQMNVYDIIEIANKHPRVNILTPGPGVGGHCIPIDPWFLVGDYPQQTELIQKALKINETRPEYVLKKAAEIAKEHGLSPAEIGIYGMTYKKDVDDTRDSPTMQLFNYLDKQMGYPFNVYDPLVKKKVLESQLLNFDEFLEKSRLVIVMVDHQHLIDHKTWLEEKIILDTRHCLVGSYFL
ncbi:nucleotide sugar dehydrogenase [Carnobacterium maltaromaticum]|uniref:nucleotide sugar dehydrogenase n=1 Tax=Carnobacterium maltaromaticum TaxID=2751 RepID=UPI00295F3D78|nr:nucleotide sugar dehydrogenase [Carnobacterium maltaromaticum]